MILDNTIKVNPLPAPTWNWLRVNDTEIRVEDEPMEAVCIADLPGEISDSAVLEEEDVELLLSAESGMGKEFAGWIAGCPVDPAVLTTTVGMQPEKPAVLEYYSTPGSMTAARCRLVARKGSEMTVVMRISGKTAWDLGTLWDENTRDADKAEQGNEDPDNKDPENEDLDNEDMRGVDAEGTDAPEAATEAAIAIETRILVEDGAKVHLIQVCDPGEKLSAYCDVAAVLGEDSEFTLLQITLGRENTLFGAAADLHGDRSRLKIDAAYTAAKDQQVDINYVARHRGVNTESEIKVNGVLRAGAKKAFRGTIDFIRGCKGSKGDEREDVLLLDEDVVNRTVPLILCTEEDVEGSHGATIGDLSEESLYYFRSRGISDEAAYQLLADGRMAAAVRMIPVKEIRDELLSKYGEEENM